MNLFGDADLAMVPRGERVWVSADEHVPGFVDLVPEHALIQYVFDPGLVVPGLLIEDLHPDARGRFSVPNTSAGTELRFSLPSSHVFEPRVSDEPHRVTRTALEGETVELMTIRTLSISARVLRADSGQPAKFCPGYFHFRDEAEERRYVMGKQCDREGFFSAGFVPPQWGSMTDQGREDEKKRWVFVEWMFDPLDPSLEPLKGRQRLDGGEFFVDLGDIYLEPKPVVDAVVYGANGAPLPGASVRCPDGTILRSRAKGQLKLPGDIRDKHLTVLAVGHALRHFSSSDLAPAEDGVIALRLDAGIELHISIAEEYRRALARTRDPEEDYRISVSWEETPFLRSPQTRDAFDERLHSELMDLNEGLGGSDARDGPATCASLLPESGVVRLFSLRAGVQLRIRLRGVDGSILSSVDLLSPKEPGVHECKLTSPPPAAAGAPEPHESFRILGQVLDGASVPVAGVSVTYDLQDLRGYLGTDKDGRFESGPLPVNEWPADSPFKIRLRAEGHVDVRREWPVQASMELSQLVFVMPRSRRIEIRVVDGEGSAVPITRVTLEGHPDIEFEGASKEPGVWVSEEAPDVDLRLLVHIGKKRYPMDLGANESTGQLSLVAGQLRSR